MTVSVAVGRDAGGRSRSCAGCGDPAADADLAFGAVIGRLLRTTTEARRKGDLAVQLQTALDSRIVVEQAKGVLMEREGLSAQAAFERLRRQARSRSMRIDDLARQLIAGRPPEPPTTSR